MVNGTSLSHHSIILKKLTFSKANLPNNVTWKNIVSNDYGDILYTAGTDEITLNNYVAKSIDTGKTWVIKIIGKDKPLSNINCDNNGSYIIIGQGNHIMILE